MPQNFRPYKRKRTGAGKRDTRKRARTTNYKSSVPRSMVRAMIRSEMETKHTDCQISHQLLEEAQPTAIPFLYRNEGVDENPRQSIHPKILAGGAAHQRIGNKVYLQRMKMRLHLYSVPTFEVSASAPSMVRIMVVQFTDSVPTASGFLDTADDVPSDTPVLAQFRTTTNTPYRVLYDRVFAPERVKGYSGSTYALGGDNWIIQKSITINKEVHYGSNASTAPLYNPIGVYAMLDDNQTGGSAPVFNLRGTVRFSYKDA